jgi:hypothetical protein
VAHVTGLIRPESIDPTTQEPIRAHSYGSLDHSPGPSRPFPAIYHASPLRGTELIEGHERGPGAPPTQLHQTQGETLVNYLCLRVYYCSDYYEI